MKLSMGRCWNATDRGKTEAVGEKPVPIYSKHLEQETCRNKNHV